MPVFQDNLFSSTRMVERTLSNGTVLRLKLDPLSGERVRVLEYHRKAPGERWQRLSGEEGRTLGHVRVAEVDVPGEAAADKLIEKLAQRVWSGDSLLSRPLPSKASVYSVRSRLSNAFQGFATRPI